MNEAVDTPAVESVQPTPVQAALAGDNFPAFKAARAAERQSGNQAPVLTSSDSSPAKPVDQASATADGSTEAASEPAAAPAKKHANADTRKTELQADIARLLAERRALEEGNRRIQTPPADKGTDAAPVQETKNPTASDWKRIKALPGAPRLDDPQFESVEDYQIAASAFVFEHLERERAAQVAERAARAAAEAQDREVGQSWLKRVDAAKAELPDFEEVALNAPTAIAKDGLIHAWILDSDLGAKVLYALQKSPAEIARIQALPAIQQTRELAKLEASLETPAKPTKKVISTAPAPLPTITQRPNDESDPEHAAVAAGDFVSFQRAKRAKAAAERR